MNDLEKLQNTELIAMYFYAGQRHYESNELLQVRIKPLIEMGKSHDEIYNIHKELDDSITDWKNLKSEIELILDKRLLNY